MTSFFPVFYFAFTVFLLLTPARQPAVRFVRPTACGGEWALLHFVKTDKFNPVLTPGKGVFMDPIRKTTVAWESKDVFNPAIVVRSGRIYMLYRAQDRIGQPEGTSRIGLAESTDGFHFVRHPAPVLYPDNDAEKKYEWEGGCEDPRVVEDEKGVYYMTYTAFDGHTARLLVATSPDLVHWTKHGPAFAKAYHGKYVDNWSKSGAIVSRYTGGRIIATRIHGKYWMYWGDKSIWAATSDNLIDWTPVEEGGGIKIVVPPRTKKFDSDLVESGPPAMLTDKGILLIYNSRNLASGGEAGLAAGAYTAGEVLLDKDDPTHLLQRLDHYFIHPDKPYEMTGQVDQVCFLEGLAQFHHHWFLYYGTADSKIAVATRPVD
jgi:beta-1,2-mannosidase